MVQLIIVCRQTQVSGHFETNSRGRGRLYLEHFQVSVAAAAVLAGQDPGAGGHADGVAGYGDLEADAVSGEPVDVRRADHLVAVAACFEGAELVADAEDHVGSLHGCFVRVAQSSPNAPRIWASMPDV